jgi:prevent-host-death family protein
MKSVPIQDLKSGLSRLLAEVASGERIVITRHRRPVAVLCPPEDSADEHVRVGRDVGRRPLVPLFDTAATAGRYLDVLAEDRGDDR